MMTMKSNNNGINTKGNRNLPATRTSNGERNHALEQCDDEDEDASTMTDNTYGHGHIPCSCPSEDDNVFEVKTRKGRRNINPIDSPLPKKSSLLNSLTYSASTLSLHKPSIFPTTTGRKKGSISMSLSRGNGSDGEDNVKITGYLEKRSKMLGWKQYWFVLDGRLLTYYKSKADYDSLSVCSGSINLGIASTVRPIQIRGCKGYPLQIVTRSQVYYLRSPNKQILEQWLIAIQEAASSQPSKISFPVCTDPGSQFFRYSFASSSQWSLNTSTEDISESLSKLPPNFYLKSKPSIDTGSNNLKKCHSFASLQAPSSYSPMSSFKDKLNNNSIKKKSSKEAEDCPRYPNESLKEELTRKLSAGKVGEDDIVKPSLTKPKSKSELPFLLKPIEGEPKHYYDEIVDFEALYENESKSNSTRSSASSGSGSGQRQDKDTGLYEHVDSVEDNEKSDKRKSKKTRKSQLQARNSSGSSRKSTQSAKSEGNKKMKSKDDTMSSSNPGTLNKSTSQRSSTTQHRKLDERNASLESTSSSIYSSKENVSEGNMMKKKKKKALSGFFHKMFNKNKKPKDSETQNQQNALVITGPIDLRGLHQDSPLNRPTNLPLDEARKTTLSRTQSGRTPDEHVVDGKPEKTYHSIPLTPVADHILSKVVHDPEPSSAVLSRENSGKATLPRPQIPKKPQLAKTDSPGAEGQVVHRRKPSSSEDFQQKLAKFNRLSARLSSTFEAVLNPPPSNYPSIGGVGRSRSLKFQKNNPEPIPPLPPKMKCRTSASSYKNCYDYPTNNKPVVPVKKVNGTGRPGVHTENKNDESQSLANADSEKPVLRNLRKKHSAPDISFSSRSNSGGSASDTKDELDNVFEEVMSSPPPPIPPKTVSSTLGQPESATSDGKADDDKPPPKPNHLEVVLTSREYDVPEGVEPQSYPIRTSAPENGTNRTVSQNQQPLTDHNSSQLKGLDEKLIQKLKFATINTLVQEYETVEEVEAEISEMYDDFPSEYSGSGGGSHTYESIRSLSPTPIIPTPQQASSVRHSGIDALQLYLNTEYDQVPEEYYTDPSFPAVNKEPIRQGAVSRLGHSSAVDQLKRIVHYTKTDV